MWLGEGEVKEVQARREARLFYGSLMAFTLPAQPGVTYRMAHTDAASARGPSGRSVTVGTPQFRQSLHVLATQFGARSIRAGIERDHVYVVMEQPSRARPLNVARITRSAYRCEPLIRATLAQIAQIHRVMDALAEACHSTADGAPHARARDS